MKILVVEDEKEINKLMSDFLVDRGYEVVSLFDGLKVLSLVEKGDVDAILLDIMLPYKNGDMILADVRKISEVPVVILSAKETTQNKIDLLRLGADDYITKPFDMEELLARLESVMRRAGANKGTAGMLTHNGLTIDNKNNKAILDGKELALTAKEFAILEMLLKYPEKVFAKANLYESVWGEEYLSEDNALSVHISNLRNKLKAVAPEKDFIDTVWGIGFRLHKEE